MGRFASKLRKITENASSLEISRVKVVCGRNNVRDTKVRMRNYKKAFIKVWMRD